MKKSMFLVVLLCVITLAVKAQGYAVGDLASDFKLKNVDGKMVSLSDDKQAKGMVVVFTCNPCPYAKAYEQRIIALDNQYASKGYPVLAINPNDPVKSPQDSYENIQKRAKEKSYPFPYLQDGTQEITRLYGAKATPHFYILKKEGSGFRVAYIGALDDDTENTKSDKITYAEDAINALLRNEKPKITQTKAIGCTIKWK
jgi:peroxiredoxin